MTEALPIIVLMVEDDEMVALPLADALADGGYEVVHSLSASEALAALDDRSSELAGVITDINLGADQLPGWEVARHARQLNPEIPVVYMTGDSAAEWASQGVPRSVLLRKPFASAELVAALANLRKIE